MSLKKSHKLLTLAAIIMIAAFYFSVQFSTQRIIGEDGYFHIRFASLLPETGLPRGIPALKFSIWNSEYRDHHLLFHLLLVPFSFLPSEEVGGKISAALFATMACLIFLWGLKQLGTRRYWLWVGLFMAGSFAFLLRIQMPRVQSLALLCLILVIIGLCKSKYKLVFIVSLLNVYLYDSFALLFMVGAVWSISSRYSSGKWEVHGLKYLVGGLLTGMIINPYFPDNLTSYYFNFSRSLAPLGSIPITGEWYPYNTWQIVQDCVPALIVAAMVFLIILGASSWKKENTERIFLGLLSVVFVALYFKSRRYVEYTFPVVLMALAVMFRDLSDQLSPKRKLTFIIASVTAIVAGGTMNVNYFVNSNKVDSTHTCYMNAGKWLNENVAKGEIIFISDWDDFPFLYFNAPRLSYVTGLDPLFTKLYNEDLYTLYADITQGREKPPYAEVIKNKFNSSYIFSDTKHQKFLKEIDKEKNVQKVFGEHPCRIYKIN